MRTAILLSGLLVFISGRSASAQNIWPVSFGYWFNCPDRHMPDFLGADQSIDRAKMLDHLCVDEIRGVMSLRSQAMSQQELARYNSPNMLPPIFPESVGANRPADASPGRESSEPKKQGEGTTAPAAPPTSRSPFPSGPKPAPSADRETPTAPLPSSSPTAAPASSPSPAEDGEATKGRGIKPS
jgi:hypothetical protein